MNNLDYVFQVICVGLVIATFLLNTGRGVKAVEVCKECLIFLNNKVLRKKKEKFVNLVRIAIYKITFTAYCIIPDYTNAIKHGDHLLGVIHNRGKTSEDEGILLLRQAMIYEKLFKYGEAGKLYEKAISVMKELGDRKGEAAAYGKIGIVVLSLSEYGKAKKYLEEALAISIEIGDKRGEATDYGNLGNIFLLRGEYGKAKEYLEKALAIAIEICDREEEASCYGN